MSNTRIKQAFAILRRSHNDRLVDYIYSKIDEGGHISLRPWAVAQESNVSEHTAKLFLEKLANLEFLHRLEYIRCPCEHQHEVSLETDNNICPYCDKDYIDVNNTGPIRDIRYENKLPAAEDIRWMILLHGMNSTGTWQQEFTWLISQQWGYAIPVYIYKYGIVRLGVLTRHSQQILKQRVVTQILSLCTRMEHQSFGHRPDVIAHSFGTWLIVNALRDNPELKIRRLILVAGIVEPNFDWSILYKRNQIESVLCHFSPVDKPVIFTHYCIPNSGPSGRIGFNDRANVIHRRQDNFGHSDYFNEDNLENIIENVWGKFLTLSKERLHDEIGNTSDQPHDWKPKGWPIRAGRIPWV